MPDRVVDEKMFDRATLLTDRRFELLEANLAKHNTFDIETAMRVTGVEAALGAFKDQMAETLVSQKEQVQSALVAQKEMTYAAMTAAKEAVLKAEIASDKRFDGVNEFRETLADQQRNLMPRAEVDVIVRGFAEKIASNQAEMLELRASRNGTKAGYGLAVGIVGFVLTLLLLADMLLRFLK
jgi:phosphopantetheinyl transferase (holo-ACP synthase)